MSETGNLEEPMSSEEAGQWLLQINQLMATMKARGYKRGWVVYRLAELKPPLEVWRVAGHYLGFKPGWAFHKYQEFTLGIKQ